MVVPFQRHLTHLAWVKNCRAFNITFSDQTSTIQYAWQRVGASARLIGLIMAHSDDEGLDPRAPCAPIR